MIDYKELLYYSGTRLRIIFARSKSKSLRSKDFLDSLESDSLMKLDRVLKRLEDYGKVFNTEQFKTIGDDLWEVKEPGGKRLIGYFRPAHFVLTHGFEKRGGGRSANKVPAEEKERANRIREEFEFEFKRMVRGSSK